MRLQCFTPSPNFSVLTISFSPIINVRILSNSSTRSSSMAISFSLSFSSTKQLTPPNTSIFNLHGFNPSLSKLFFASPNPKSLKFKPRRSAVKSLFTGIVEEVGEVKKLGHGKDGGFDLEIRANTILGDVKLGDSIAVNGTCLTVTEFDIGSSDFIVGLAPETLRKTSLIELLPGSLVNLERAVLPSTRMGGHFVQGHVDGTGEIVSLDREDDSLWVKVKTTSEVLRYIVPKGFIAVDGTSLTVVDVFDDENCFNFMMVAYTQQNVVIPLKKVGQKVNLEVDILGKYVEKLLINGSASNTVQSS